MFPAHVTESPVLDGRGQLIGIVGISTDITARKQAEEQMRQKDTLIRMAGRLTHTGGWAIEVPGDRMFWSDELFDILEYARAACRLSSTRWRSTPNRGGTDRRRHSRMPAGRHAIRPRSRKSSRLRARESGCASARRPSDADRLHTPGAGALQDITERKRLEQQYCARSAWRASARWPAASPTI